MGALLALGVGLFLVAQCMDGANNQRLAADEDRLSADQSTQAAMFADTSEDAAATAQAALEDTTYADQGRPYGCTEDCSGHDAGYEWAGENDVTDPDDCGGNSQSFIEGCKARAEAYQAAYEDAGGELE